MPRQKHLDIDGAYFGTSFPNVLLKVSSRPLCFCIINKKFAVIFAYVVMHAMPAPFVCHDETRAHFCCFSSSRPTLICIPRTARSPTCLPFTGSASSASRAALMSLSTTFQVCPRTKRKWTPCSKTRSPV